MILLGLSTAPATAVPATRLTEAAAPTEQPALWVVSDADTTIYLFGTFHALDSRTDWFGQSVKAAFDSADQLVLETIVPTDPAELFAALSRHAMTGPAVAGQPVTGPAVAGQPVTAPEPARAGSFVASAGQAMAVGKTVGLSIETGADAVLRRFADAGGKPVHGLETFDQQLGMFARLPGAPKAAKSRSGAAASGTNIKARMVDMSAAWRRGDSAHFAAVLAALRADSPATYQAMFVDRNHVWASWIAERMDQPGTVFVAVGTGHLIGADSVQQKLAARGLMATRIH